MNRNGSFAKLFAKNRILFMYQNDKNQIGVHSTSCCETKSGYIRLPARKSNRGTLGFPIRNQIGVHSTSRCEIKSVYTRLPTTKSNRGNLGSSLRNQIGVLWIFRYKTRLEYTRLPATKSGRGIHAFSVLSFTLSLII